MFRVVLPPIIRSAYSCIYSIWYLSHRYGYLPLSWKSWNRFECAVGGVRHPQHAPDDGWKYHPKHVEQFPDINKLCNAASCWICEYIGILLEAHPILHISRIRVKHHAMTALGEGKGSLVPPITNLLIRFRRVVSRPGRFSPLPIGQKAGFDRFRVYRVTPDTSIRP
jgi:hypothetical protein